MPRKKIERTDKYCVAYVTVNPDGTPVISYYGHMRNGGITLVDSINSKKVNWYESIEEAQKHIMNYNECVIKFMKPIESDPT